MAAFFKPSGMPIEKQAVQLHDPVDPLVVGRGRSRCASRSAQHGMNAAVAVGRQILDDLLDPGDQIAIGLGRTANPPPIPALRTLGDVGAGNANRLAHRLHREPSFGHDSDRNICLWNGSPLRFSASW